MALAPFATLKLLPENATQPKIRPRMVIAHSAGGEGELYGWWQNEQSRGLESHFWIGRDGRIVQYIDTGVRADANGEANSYALSIETQSTVQAAERWDAPQAAALVRLIDWCCTTHGIPRREATTATGDGLAWHVQFGAPGPWTKSTGKVCPGPKRIVQYRTEVIPAVVAAETARTRPAPAPRTGVSAPSGTPALRSGNSGAQVAKLQVALNYGTGTRLTGDAQFGPSTEQAVKNMQAWCKLTADGVYGPASQWVLQIACDRKAAQ